MYGHLQYIALLSAEGAVQDSAGMSPSAYGPTLAQLYNVTSHRMICRRCRLGANILNVFLRGRSLHKLIESVALCFAKITSCIRDLHSSIVHIVYLFGGLRVRPLAVLQIWQAVLAAAYLAAHSIV